MSCPPIDSTYRPSATVGFHIAQDLSVHLADSHRVDSAVKVALSHHLGAVSRLTLYTVPQNMHILISRTYNLFSNAILGYLH